MGHKLAMLNISHFNPEVMSLCLDTFLLVFSKITDPSMIVTGLSAGTCVTI